MEIICVPYQTKWLASVARLHRKGITTGFISRLGPRFISTLYGAIAVSRWSRVFVAVPENGQEPVGFIACSIDTSRMYRGILVSKGLLFAAILLPRAFRFSVLKSIFETIFYPVTHRSKAASAPARKPESFAGHISAELLSVAVDAHWQGKGVGKLLLQEMERCFAQQGVERYKVVTLASDPVSNGFYVARGFTLSNKFVHHGNEMNEYTKAI